MKKQERINLTLGDELLSDIGKVASKNGVTSAAFIRLCMSEVLEKLTGKKYPELSWGGSRRSSAGRISLKDTHPIRAATSSVRASNAAIAKPSKSARKSSTSTKKAV